MNSEFQELYNTFLRIKSLGWIKCKYKGDGAIGRQFEELIGNNDNSFEIPDFNGIEIKTKYSNIEKFMTLFSYAPEGENFFESKRIKDEYGYPDKDFPNFKVLNGSIYFNLCSKFNENYIFFPKFDKNKKKIVLNIYDNNLTLIENSVYWSIKTIEEKMLRKIKYLAIISADRKYENGMVYCRYTKISFYIFKGIDFFINQFIKHNIRITFKLNIYKSGNNIGKIHDHGTSFDVRCSNITQLYDEIKIQ